MLPKQHNSAEDRPTIEFAICCKHVAAVEFKRLGTASTLCEDLLNLASFDNGKNVSESDPSDS
jgi:hypothetical protein